MKRHTRIAVLMTAATVVLPLSACGSDDSGGGKPTAGPIDIWYSTNEQEQAWAEAVVDAWNAEHPEEKITARAVPAGKSTEDVIGAAITAGNTPLAVSPPQIGGSSLSTVPSRSFWARLSWLA